MFIRPSITFILGPLLSKKTWLALDLGVCTATGSSWLGIPCQPTTVFFIDETHGLAETRRRLSVIQFAHNTPADLPFHFSSFPGYDLTDPNDLAAISQNAQRAGLIIIDQPYGVELGEGVSLPTLHPLVSSSQTLAHSANAALLVLLNTQTRSQRTALAAALVALGVNQVLGLDFYPTDMPQATPWSKFTPRYRAGYLHLRTLANSPSLFKGEGVGGWGQSFISLHAKIHATETTFSLTAIDRIPELQTLKNSSFQTSLGSAGFAILRFLESKGSASTRELMLGVQAAVPTRIRTLVHQLAREGYIACIKRGGAGHPAIYALTVSGRSLI